MRRMTWVLLFLGCVAGLGSRQGWADDEPVNLESLSWIIGEWEGEYILPDGVPEIGQGGSQVTHTESWRWAMNRKFIVLNLRDEIAGKVAATGQEILGLDESTGKLTHWYFGSTGGQGHGTWARRGNCWMLHWQGISPGGKKVQGTSDQILLDADTYTWQMRDITENGEKVADWPKVTLKRKQRIASRDDALWQSYRDACAGTWTGQGVLSRDLPDLNLTKGDQFTYQLTWTPELGGKALSGGGPFTIASKNFTAEARALSGWDPATGQVRLLAFWSGGLVEEILISKRQGNAFVGTYTVAVPGAETQREPIRIVFPDADHYVIKFVGASRRGEVLSSFTRVARED